MLPIFSIGIVFVFSFFTGSAGDYGDWTTNESFDQWTGGMPPLNWHFDPGPCLPPEEPDCRGVPYYNCFRWWLPCGFYARGEVAGDYSEMVCCWSQGSKATTRCRNPDRRLEEMLGSHWYTYCLPTYVPYPNSRSRNGTGTGSSGPGHHGSQVISQLTEIADNVAERIKKCKNKKHKNQQH